MEHLYIKTTSAHGIDIHFRDMDDLLIIDAMLLCIECPLKDHPVAYQLQYVWRRGKGL